MQAVRIHEFGGADRLTYEPVALPEPKAGEVRVEVAAIGLNFIEIYQRKGLYPNPLPFTIGNEFAGLVDAVGAGVTGFKVGDRVATAHGAGAYAEYATVPVARLAHIPDRVTLDQAAALILQGITAHALAVSTYPLKSGDTALVHAAAGGVGLLLVQIAKMRGAQVIATVSNAEKAELARQAGADQVILYSRDDFEAEVKRLTDGKGVEVVYDGVGQVTFLKSLNCLKPRGYMVLYGQASGPVEPVNPQLLNQKGSLFLTRPTNGHYLLNREEFEWRTNDLFGWLQSGQLKLRIDKTFPLEHAAQAQEYMESRQTKGKVILLP